MTLQANTLLGKGGIGMHGTEPGGAVAMLKELQGMQVSLLTGAGANTKINLTAIRNEDTILSAIMFAAGVPSDITANASIDDLRATGTLTLSGVVANDTCVVDGRTYTFKTAGTADPLKAEVDLGGDMTITAANLAAKINQIDGHLGKFVATSALGVVTLTAMVEGTGGNAYTIVGSTHITASGATLAGGSATGGVRFTSSTATNTVLLFWFNKQ